MITFNNKEQRFEIPKPRSSGVLMTVSNQEDFYKIELRATKDLKMKDYLLLGKQGGTVRFSLNVNANKQENSAIVKVLKDILDEGILELTLVNQNNKPIAERLLFHEKETGIPTAKITTDKEVYDKRVPVVMEISLDASDLAKTTADMSLSVSNLAVNATANNMTDIKTYLLLNSAVKGKIEQPGYYFYNNHPERRLHLDILIRTQGWRQYVLEEELVTSSNYFLPEKGLSLSGQVVNASNPKETLTGSVSLTSNNASEMLQDKVETRSDGTFSFTNLSFTDTTKVLLSAHVYYPNKKRNPTLNYKIILDSGIAPATGVAPIYPLKMKSKKEESLQSSKHRLSRFTGSYKKAQQTTQAIMYNNKTIQLDEAFIAAKKQPKALDKFEKKRRGMPYKEPSQTADFEDFKEMGFTNLLDALRGRIPGLSVRDDTVYLRSASNLSGNSTSAALILLDGSPVGKDILYQMLPSNVDFIDVLKGPRAAIYGSRAANGVIAIYTKNGTESAGKTTKAGGSLNIEHPGYAVSRTFYDPKYDNQQPQPIEVDNRSTLYWQPLLALNDNGKAIISFYTADMLGDYVVRLQGITIAGTPFYSQTLFSVE
jgi:TonB-dependent SusC/RagA subfamily outer membrane receptor